MLLPLSDKSKGCEVIFADSLFFKNGEISHIVKMDKDYCLSSIKN